MKLKELMKQRMPISNGMFLLIVLMFSLASAICAGITATMVVYDNSRSGLGAITVQDAIDEIMTKDVKKIGNLDIEGGIRITGDAGGIENLLTFTDKTQDGSLAGEGATPLVAYHPVTTIANTGVNKWLKVYYGSKIYYIPLFQ